MVANGLKGSMSRNIMGNYSNDRCELCKPPHKNSQYYKQHPELAPKIRGKNNRGKKGKAKVSARTDDVDELDNIHDAGISLSSVAKVSSASYKNKNPLQYETSASHHLIRLKEDFISLKKLAYPFEFDQAVGKSALTRQGTCRLRVGNLMLDFHESLYSPNSACNIISAVKLKNEYGIVAAAANQLLVRIKDDHPIAKLVEIVGVLYTQPLKHANKYHSSDNKAAPGVARLPRTSNA